LELANSSADDIDPVTGVSNEAMNRAQRLAEMGRSKTIERVKKLVDSKTDVHDKVISDNKI
jgi:hypothetical protein